MNYTSAFSGATIDQAVAKSRRIHFGSREVSVSDAVKQHKVRLSDIEKYSPSQVFVSIKTGGSAGDPANYVSATTAYENLHGDQYGWFVYLRSTTNSATLSGTYYISWLVIEDKETGSDDDTSTEADNIRKEIAEMLAAKVDAVTGKGLSTNDYTDEDKINLHTLMQLDNLMYSKSNENILSSVEFTSKKCYISKPQANAPFENENYEYINATDDSSVGVISSAFLLPNGRYRLVADKTNKNITLAIYNPFYGCYAYAGELLTEFEWLKQDNKYVYDFVINTDYGQNYVILGDPSTTKNTWESRNVKLYHYENNFATKSELLQHSSELEKVKLDVTKNAEDISTAESEFNQQISNALDEVDTAKSEFNQQITNVRASFNMSIGGVSDGLKNTNKNIDRIENEIYDEIDATNENVSKNAVDIKSNADSIANLNDNQIYTSSAGYIYSKNAIALNGATAIGIGAYRQCKNLLGAIIPDGVTIIGRSAFNNCTGLANVTIPNSVTRIEDYAFQSCTSLKNIIISDGVTFIGFGCFKNCKALKDITIPASITTFSKEVFRDCSSLTNVVLGSGFNANNLDFSSSPLLSVESMVDMFEALSDLTGEDTKNITLGATNLAKLNDEQKQIAINKNWNLIRGDES